MLILVSTVTGCLTISAFASLVCVPVGITSSVVGIKICTIAAWMKNYKSVIKKKKKKHDKIIFLEKDKTQIIIDSNISHNEFNTVNNELRKYNKTKEEIKTSV